MKFVTRLCVATLASLFFATTQSPAQIYLNAGTIDTDQPTKQSAARSAAPSGSDLRLVQFDGPIQPEWVANLEAAGYRIVDYIPDYTYLVYGNAASLNALRAKPQHVRWEGAYIASDKINPRIYRDSSEARRAAKNGQDLFAIQLMEDAGMNAATLELIESLKDAPIRSVDTNEMLRFVNIIVSLPEAALSQIAERPDVVSITTWTPPKKRGERQAQIVAGNVNLAGSQPSGPGYYAWLLSKGFTQTQFDDSGLVVDIADDGWDLGTASSPANREFRKFGAVGQASRMKYSRKGTNLGASGSHGADGHGNINISIVGGFSTNSGSPFVDTDGYHRGQGINPFVIMGNTKVFEDGGSWGPSATQERSFIATNYYDGVRISSDSWGMPGDGTYNSDAQNYDTWTRDSRAGVAGNQQVLYVFAAGNDGPGTKTIGEPGTGKNIFSIGAAENYNQFGTDGCAVPNSGANNANDIIDFSSRGPCTDSRVKPDIMAPGTHIAGAASFYSGYTGEGVCDKYQPAGQTNYAASSGTSHSTPAVAGAASLVYQYFINQSWAIPSPAMMKAYLMNSTRYMTGVDANDTLPSNAQGMGMINLGIAFDGAPRILRDQLTNEIFTASGQSRTYFAQVAQTTNPVRVTLGWTDAPGSTSGNAYKNNLDIEVTAGGTTYKGNVFNKQFSKSGGSADIRNNVESVFLPTGTVGTVTIVVKAFNINSDGVPGYGGSLDQDFVLVGYNLQEVAPSNMPPVLNPIGNKNVNATNALSFSVTATDPVDGDPITLTASNLPSGAVFGSTNGNGSFEWSDSNPPGSYTPTFYATDKDGSVSETITIFVSDGSCAPARVLDENFDAGAGVPAGWSNNLTANDTASAHYSSGPNCRAFGTGAYLITPAVDSPTQLMFYVDASSGGNGKTGTVEYSTNGSTFVSLGSFTASTAGSVKTFALTSSPDLSAAQQVRFRFSSSFNTWYLDDVIVDSACGGAPPVNTPPTISVAGGTNQGALVGQALNFDVTADDVDGDTVLLEMLSGPAGATFADNVGPAPLQIGFSWTPAATGIFSAVFAAEDDSSGVTQGVTIVVTEPVAPLNAPVIQAGSAIQTVQFNANWLAVSNATGYVLDVSTNSSFASGGGTTNIAEDFSLFVTANGSVDRSGSLNTYMHTSGWTGEKVYEDAGRAKLGSSSARGILTTPTIDLSGNGGTATLLFDLGQFGTDEGPVQVRHAPDGVTFTQVGADITPPAAMTQQSIEITGGTASSKLQLYAKGLSKHRFYLDNLAVVQGGGAGDYVAGYEQRNVANVTTFAVTGLTEDVTYHYRVMAYNNDTNSAYSAATNVTTAGATNIPPALNPIGNKSVIVSNALQFEISATPTDGDPVTLSVDNLPSGAVFNSTNEAGTFFWSSAEPVGPHSVTFYAADKDGTNSEAVLITVGPASEDLLPPVILAASAVQAEQFNANWQASDNATGYLLDVGTNETFTGGGGGGDAHTNDFSGIGGGVASSYLTRIWTNNGTIVWTAYKARSDETVNGAASVCLRNEAGAYLTTSSITNGVGDLRFTVQQKFSGSGGILTVSANGTTLGSVNYDTTIQTAKFENIDISGSVTLTISNNAAARPAINDLVWTDLSGGSSPAYVPGYEQRDVGNVTTYAVTGLTEGVQYHYRVMAYNATSNSAYSAVTNVVTEEQSGTPPTLNPPLAQNVFLGERLEFAVTATPSDGDPVTLTASNLPSGSVFNPTNEAGTFLWSSASPLGNYSVSFRATDKDGYDEQSVGITVHPLPDIGSLVISNGNDASATFLSVSGRVYQMQYTEDLAENPVLWSPLQTITGMGSIVTLSDTNSIDPIRMYRIVAP